jgi:hypothetical protein
LVDNGFQISSCKELVDAPEVVPGFVPVAEFDNVFVVEFGKDGGFV